MRGRDLQVGDEAYTDYNGPGPMTRVRIVDVDRDRRHGHSQTGVMFRVTPNLRNGGPDHWYDSGWFEPVPATQEDDHAPSDYPESYDPRFSI